MNIKHILVFLIILFFMACSFPPCSSDLERDYKKILKWGIPFKDKEKLKEILKNCNDFYEKYKFEPSCRLSGKDGITIEPAKEKEICDHIKMDLDNLE
jgi:hypothetical protein